uniref:Chromo domain-containing protein n=1 Tax=Macrostomum lignano TaxID=282301 RepID=A0A1I8GPH2_9PLAT
MYDLERGLNAYKYKWSGTDQEPQFLRKEKSSEEEATTGLPTEDSSSSCDTGRQKKKRETRTRTTSRVEFRPELQIEIYTRSTKD